MIKINACLIVILASLWLGATFVVDFVSMPLAFQNISSRQEAGNLGMAVFSRFNPIELGIAIVLLVLGFVLGVRKRKFKTAITFILVVIPTTYCFYLTPTISDLNKKIHHTNSEKDVKQYEEKHQSLHQAYIRMDGFKILLLLVLISTETLGLVRRKE